MPLIGLDKNNLLIMPDEDDPNFYCRSCTRTYSSARNYRVHLRKIHRMTIKLSQRLQQQNDISRNNL